MTLPTTYRRRGFTLIEVMVSILLLSMVLGTAGTALSQLGLTKSVTRDRLTASVRADAGLRAIRRDLVSVLRRDDLFLTRLSIIDDTAGSRSVYWDRDELLVFSHRLEPIQTVTYGGEGVEYEVGYRIETDDGGPVLWQRRDPMGGLDTNPAGGGVAIPLAENTLALQLEAWDGWTWHDDWDSDVDGLPYAVRITVTASGAASLDDLATAPTATLRTIVAIDRVIPPDDLYEVQEEEEEEETEEGVGAGDSATTPDTGGGAAPGRRPGGQRPGGRPGGGGRGGGGPGGGGPNGPISPGGNR